MAFFKIENGKVVGSLPESLTEENSEGYTFITINSYGICNTKSNVKEKIVNCEEYVLETGCEVTVRFTHTNTVENPTLNVNGSGAKPIYYRGSAISPSTLAATRTYLFRFNGEQYEFVGDVSKDYPDASTYSDGLMTMEDKTKLLTIEEGANNYTHPTAPGYKHIPNGGEEGDILKWSSTGTAEWGKVPGVSGFAKVATTGSFKDLKDIPVLTIGPYVFDGSKDITIPIYNGEEL